MSLVALATRRRVTIAMATIAVLLFGTVALSRLNVNLLPDLAHPALTIRTELEGAAPAEIENLITKPVEEALGVVKNVEEIRSVSRTGQSDVILEFGWGTNMDYASLDVREKLDALDLPLEARRPSILRFDPSLDPIMRFGLSQKPTSSSTLMADASGTTIEQSEPTLDEHGLKELRRYSDEEIKRVLESSAGVAAVKVSGGLEDEVQINVDPAKLSQFGLSIDHVAQTLESENVNLSGGRLEEGTQQYLVRTLNQFQSVDAFKSVILSSSGPTPIYLRDVADVRLGYRERETITRIDGREAVEIAIYKEGDANTVAVADAVSQRLDRVRETMPKDLELTKVYDQSVFIASAIDEVVSAGLIGGILAILVLYLFLRDVKTTLIIGLTIPISVIATFNLMYGANLSLNIMSLGGLALGIGLLVDNAIVVLENIARHREMGKSARAAATAGAGEVGMAIMASTLTTIAVFGPLVFVEGIAGQLFRDQALTVTFSLLASLVAALTLIPMLASFEGRSSSTSAPSIPWPTRPSLKRLRAKMRRSGWAQTIGHALGFGLAYIPWILGTLLTALVWSLGWIGLLLYRQVLTRVAGWFFAPFQWVFTHGYDAIATRYPTLLRAALARPALVLVTAFGLLAGSLLLVPQLGVELIPQMAQNEFDLEMRLPPGTPLDRSDATLARLQSSLRDHSAVTTTFAVAGTGTRMDANPDQGGENWGEMHVELDAAAGREGEASAISSLRAVLNRIPGAEYELSRPSLFSFDTPIEVEVAGYDLNKLKATAANVAEQLSASDRFADVTSTMEQGHPEVRIHFDRERAAALGLAVHDIADRVVQQVRGNVATRYSWRDRKIDVRVRAQAEDRATVNELRHLIVNTDPGRPIPLYAVADIRVDVGPSEIRRSAQQRVALVTANLQRGDLGAAIDEIDTVLAGLSVPTGLSVHVAGQSEEMAASFRSLLFALALALFLVYLVMASQFESLLHPFVIFFSIPLAAVGALWALWLTGTTLSVVVFIGFILLAGIVVNNAIVLIDLVNQLRADGMELVEALVEGGRLRLRPILMTTLTTTLGLIPLALGFGEGAELRAPMAVPVIGGLVVSTLLTLVVIPVLYKVLTPPGRTKIQT
ncbi:acriflavin resistance protein [Salinibacter sp. 10B]|uniref:efflux RND transporter permease subunit n=1 Tax=Salinibacter sp. 10B TaxID=1923971 RepID=UPI000CF410E0|nr:efflux RND transporter permease subunit [Salinibacter sp. 10B]PQJ35810.1 acriflavin resistance protein [Salinibacter sp. 10B]